MCRIIFVNLLFLLSLAASAFAADPLSVLEAVASASQRVQPSLQNHLSTVETSRIDTLMAKLFKSIPDSVKPPAKPVVYKFWQRQGENLFYAINAPAWPQIESLVNQATGPFTSEPNEMLLPAERVKQRQALAETAEITLSEVALADDVMIHRLEIVFPEATDLDQAFYRKALRLPQRQVTTLVFDIDSRQNTVNEMAAITADGLQLTAEFRYRAVDTGMLAERIRITSPDGRVDELYEVEFTMVEGYSLPATMTLTIRRPEIQDQLEMHFRDYRINQPLPVEVQRRMRS